MDRKTAKEFLKKKGLIQNDILAMHQTEYDAEIISDAMETYKREGVIAELERLFNGYLMLHIHCTNELMTELEKDMLETLSTRINQLKQQP